MPVFRRSSAGETDSKAADGAEQPETAPAKKSPPPQQSGKGRPTPKRSEAERARYRSIQGGTTSGRSGSASRDPGRKLSPEEKQREKERARADRQRRQAEMQAGNGPRDRGPVRKFARDYVDSHRRLSNYWMIIIVLLVVAVPTLGRQIQGFYSYIEIALVLVLVLDGYLLGQKIKKQAAARFPSESTQGVAWYAGMRAMQLRFMRFPKPTVKPGDKI